MINKIYYKEKIKNVNRIWKFWKEIYTLCFLFCLLYVRIIVDFINTTNHKRGV